MNKNKNVSMKWTKKVNMNISTNIIVNVKFSVRQGYMNNVNIHRDINERALRLT